MQHKLTAGPTAANALFEPQAQEETPAKVIDICYAQSTEKTTIVLSANLGQAARLGLIQSEIRMLGDAPTAWSVRGVPEWSGDPFQGKAPYTLIKRVRASRFRLARPLKQELLNRFCGDSGDASRLPRVLIVAAHQDDESIGAGARLFHLSDAYIVHVTDGAPLDVAVAQRHGFRDPDEYAEARWRELHSALAIAGVAKERLIPLGYVDGQVSGRLVDLCLRLTDLIDMLVPDVILTHPYEGGHTDHDATAFAVHLACGLLQREGIRPPAVLELTSYHSRYGQKVMQEFLPFERADRGQRIIHLDPEQQEQKQRMLDCFVTQRHLFDQFSTAFERFRPAPRYVFTRPPHEGQLNYERFGDAKRGSRWRQQAAHALRTLRVRGRR